LLANTFVVCCLFVFAIFIFVKKINILEKITKEIIFEIVNRSDFELKSTHSKLCIPVINRIYKKMTAGIKFSGIKVEGNLICDGHHRYLASILANFPLEKIPGNKTSTTFPVDWKSIGFEEDDWDTPAKINMLNKQDAEYNNIPIEKIIDLLK
jgi:hypothetical protein